MPHAAISLSITLAACCQRFDAISPFRWLSCRRHFARCRRHFRFSLPLSLAGLLLFFCFHADISAISSSPLRRFALRRSSCRLLR
jgi:O-antigen/teichoic acid export membrane protein